MERERESERKLPDRENSGVNWVFNRLWQLQRGNIKDCQAMFSCNATHRNLPQKRGKKRKTLVSFSAALHTDILRYAIVREAPAMLPYPSSKITPLRENALSPHG